MLLILSSLELRSNIEQFFRFLQLGFMVNILRVVAQIIISHDFLETNKVILGGLHVANPTIRLTIFVCPSITYWLFQELQFVNSMTTKKNYCTHNV